jgi:hypothetical protein
MTEEQGIFRERQREKREKDLWRHERQCDKETGPVA